MIFNAHADAARAEPRAELIIPDETPFAQIIRDVCPEGVSPYTSYKPPRYNMICNYPSLASWPIIRRSHENMSLFFMVFKPKNKRYDPLFDGMDLVRKRIGSDFQDLIITREIDSKKIHYNAMVFTKKDLSAQHEKQTSRFFIYCKKVPYADKYKVHQYIVKESMTRYFYSRNLSPMINDIYVASKYGKEHKRFYNDLTCSPNALVH